MKHRVLLVYVFVWGALVVVWNFGYATATPFQDVLAAVAILFVNRSALKRAVAQSGVQPESRDDTIAK